MSDRPINLNRVRKARARDNKRRQADENATKFGRSKAERARAQAEAKRLGRHLDGHEREE